MRRRDTKNRGLRVFSAILIAIGAVILCCCFSYKFLLVLAAAAFITIGLILVRKC